ncbi:MAG TPA: TolC family protein [Terriglobales bacterium]|nr:TolC family protein [Terriglobales bacterium]
MREAPHRRTVHPARRLARLACGALLALALGGTAAAQGPSRITLDQAIDLALTHNHTLKALRTQVQQSQAQEVTAGLRPNPVLSWDSQFLPIFQPSQFSADYMNVSAQNDLGIGYLFERGGKRHWRLQAARDQTAVTSSLIADAERSLAFNVAQQFVAVQLAQSNLELARQDLESFQNTVEISQARYQAGDMSEADLLKIKLQLLQFQTDFSSAQLAKVQALVGLRQLLGYEAVPADYEVAGELKYEPLSVNLDDVKAKALQQRPDLMAAHRGVTAADSQHRLAIANGKRDLGASFNYSHLNALNTGSFFFNIQLPLFDRNQGEIARTQFAQTQAHETESAATDQVLTDVSNAYEAFRANQKVVELYVYGYLQQAQESRDISEYAYKKGAASLLDFLDAERSYRSTQLAYRQALAAYLVALEQLKEAAGTRNLP